MQIICDNCGEAMHDPNSPLLIGNIEPGDVIHEAKQASWIDYQMRLEDFL